MGGGGDTTCIYNKTTMISNEKVMEVVVEDTCKHKRAKVIYSSDEGKEDSGR